MYKSYPGWIHQKSHLDVFLPPHDKSIIFGFTVSRNRLLAGSRVILAAALPLGLFYGRLSFTSTPLIPLLPMLALILLGVLHTTGGNAIAISNGISSFLLAITMLILVIVITAGQPWAAISLSLVLAWSGMFFWSWFDPSRRSFPIAKIFAILLLMTGFQIPSTSAGFTLVAKLLPFWMILSVAAICFLWLTVPLCLQLPKEYMVFLHNCCVVLNASILPLETQTNVERSPQLRCPQRPAQMNTFRQKQLDHLLYISILLREVPYELLLDAEVARMAPEQYCHMVALHDCLVSLSSFGVSLVEGKLNVDQWSILFPKLRMYLITVRRYIAKIILIFECQFSGDTVVPSYLKELEEVQNSHNQLLLCYVDVVKQGKKWIPSDLDGSSTSLIDHWMYQFLSLLPIINDISQLASSHAHINSAYGWVWRAKYFLKAAVLPFALIFVNAILLLRCLFVISKKMFFYLLSLISFYFHSWEHKRTTIKDASIVPEPEKMESDNHSSTSSSSEVITEGEKSQPNRKGAITQLVSNLQKESQRVAAEFSTVLSHQAPSSSLKTKEDDDLLLTTEDESEERNYAPIRGFNTTSRLPTPPIPTVNLDASVDFPNIEVSLEEKQDIASKSLTTSSKIKGRKFLVEPKHLTRPPEITWKEWTSEGRWKYPIRYVIASIPITTLSLALLLYAIPSVQTPWAITSALVLMMPSLGSTWRRLLQRSLGTVVGALIGQFVVIISASMHPFMSWGPMMVILFTAAYFNYSRNSRYSYFFIVIALSFSVIVLSTYPFDGDISWTIAAYRMLFVLLGAMWGSLCSLILPEKSYDKFMKTIRAAARATLRVIDIIESSERSGAVSETLSLTALNEDMVLLHYATIFLDPEAEAEKFCKQKSRRKIRYLRYKMKDLSYATRMLIRSCQGLGGVVSTQDPEYINHFTQLAWIIEKQVQFIDRQLMAHNTVRFCLDVSNLSERLKSLESAGEVLKDKLVGLDILSLSSHLFILRTCAVLINDVTQVVDSFPR